MKPDSFAGNRPSPRPSQRGQGGYIMVTAAILITGLMAVALVAIQRTRNDTQQTGRIYHKSRVLYTAEGGNARAQAWLVNLLETVPNPTQAQLDALPTPSAPGFNFLELSITKEARVPGARLTTGPWAGMIANVQPYRIVAHAENRSGSVEGTVNTTVDEQFVGMHQFGIFYDGDLEIFPSYPLDYHGRIHTNGNLYLGSSDVLNIDGQVTAGGHIYNTPKDSTIHLRGKARITDALGQWHDLSYDSRDPNWETKSLGDWQGRVLDADQGTLILPYPIPAPATTIDIIRRGLVTDSPELREKRFYWKAQLRILDGVAYDTAGNVIPIPAGVLAHSTVYDYREQRNMDMLNVNIAALVAAGLVPANRIIYISELPLNAAVRLVDGEQLPVGGLTIATDLPLYIWGNYNIVNKQPSSVVCDAFNVFSDIWADINAAKPLNKRIASATWVNTCAVAGNTTTTNGNYNGGAENLIRLHEKWVGHELSYRGSLVCIFESERATGDFRNASYIEAHRDWGFDPDLLDPGFWPVDELALRTLARGTWSAQ